MHRCAELCKNSKAHEKAEHDERSRNDVSSQVLPLVSFNLSQKLHVFIFVAHNASSIAYGTARNQRQWRGCIEAFAFLKVRRFG